MANTEREQEDFILQSAVSQVRVDSFLNNYREDRRQAGAIEALFSRARGFEHSPDKNDTYAFGFTLLLRKAPFVEGSSWAEYRTWEFAVAIERHIAKALEKLLPLNVETVEEPTNSLEGLLSTVDRLLSEARSGGYAPSMIIFAGALDPDLWVEFWQHRDVVPDWDLKDLVARLWVLGTYRGIPVLQLRDASTRGVCVLDVSRFGKLTKYNDLEFVVKPIDDERATDILSRDADIVKAPEGLSDSVEESKRQLLLRVEFRLYESYSFELRDAEACFSTGWTASAS